MFLYTVRSICGVLIMTVLSTVILNLTGLYSDDSAVSINECATLLTFRFKKSIIYVGVVPLDLCLFVTFPLTLNGRRHRVTVITSNKLINMAVDSREFG